METADIISLAAALLSAISLAQTQLQNKKVNDAEASNNKLNEELTRVKISAANAEEKASEAEKKTYELERKDKQKLKLRELRSAYDDMMTFDLDENKKLTTEVTSQQVHSYLRLVDSIAGARNDELIDKTSADNQLGKFIIVRCRKILNARKPLDGSTLMSLPQYQNVNPWLQELEARFPVDDKAQTEPIGKSS